MLEVSRDDGNSIFDKLLIAYVVICGFVVRDMNLFISACIMAAAYYALKLYSRKMYELIITDEQIKREKAMYGGISKISSPILWVPVGIVGIIELISILEYILGLYTSITGICTAVEEYREGSRGSGDGKRYCMVFVTDFENKRELVFETYDYMVNYKDERIKVIHSMFTKKPMMVNNMKIKYRSIL